jgi:fructosamine-3-kinase
VRLPDELARALHEAIGQAAVEARPTVGGDINEAWEVLLGDGRRIFIKTRRDAGVGEYAAEAAGLRWLAESGAIAVGQVVALNDPVNEPQARRFLALAWVQAGSLTPAGEEELGRGVAGLHASGAPSFGGGPPEISPASEARPSQALSDASKFAPLRLGRVVLSNDPLPDWPTFYGERRLRPLIDAAARARSLTDAEVRVMAALCDRLPELAGPPEPPARLHGDLWSGNVMADAGGRPVLIDPVAYGGHREVDLAMLRLFGTPSQRTLDAYEEVFPLAAGHTERVSLWQLFPLLVHAVLFGGSYGRAAVTAARRYVS